MLFLKVILFCFLNLMANLARASEDGSEPAVLARPLHGDLLFSSRCEAFQKMFGREPYPHELGLFFRINHTPEEHSILEMDVIDPKASGLDRSDQVFLQLALEPDKVLWLNQLAAPSFSGKLVVNLVKEIKRAGGIEFSCLCDSSTRLPCSSDCNGALSSLRSHKVLTHGKSWYESRGALPASFRSSSICCFEEQFKKNILRL